MTHKQYCENRMARHNALFRIDANGKMSYVIDGTTYSQKELDEKFPITGNICPAQDRRQVKGKHLDPRTNW